MPEIEPSEDNDNIIDFEAAKREIQAGKNAKPEKGKFDLEAERSHLESRVLEACSLIESRAHSLIKRSSVAYDRIDSPDVPTLKKDSAEMYRGFLATLNNDRQTFIDFARKARSLEDIELIKQKLEQEMLTGSMVNLDEGETQVQELEILAKNHDGGKLLERFAGGGNQKELTEEDLEAMPPTVRNTIIQERSRTEQETLAFEAVAEQKIQLLQRRYEALKSRAIKKIEGAANPLAKRIAVNTISPENFGPVDSVLKTLADTILVFKNLPKKDKFGLQAISYRNEITRMLENLEALSNRIDQTI